MAWLPYGGTHLAEKNMVFRQQDDRDFCVFWDDRLGTYLMYYACAGVYPGLPGLNTIVRVRTSNDLFHCSDRTSATSAFSGMTGWAHISCTTLARESIPDCRASTLSSECAPQTICFTAQIGRARLLRFLG